MNAHSNRPSHTQRPLALSRLAIGALLALGGASGAQAQSLVELYEAARGFDATYLSALSQFDASQAKAAQARAGLLPQAGLAAAANWARRDSSAAALEGTSNSQSVALSASHPLYRPANQLVNDQAQLSIDVAKAQLDTAEQDLIVRTTQAYFDVLAAEDTLTFVKAQKTAVSEQLAAAKRNFEVGTTTVTDSREAQARFDLVLAQEIAAENDLRVKKLALDQLVGKAGVAPKPLAAPVALPALTPADPQAWVAQAETRHPAVLQATKGLEMAQLETRKAETGHQPTLDLVGQYQIARAPTTGFPNNVRTNTASVGLQFNMPLYTGGAVQNRIKETLALEDKARTDLQAAQRGVSQATRAAYFGVLSGQGQVKALEAAEASSQSALDANKLGYQVGVRINIDVLNAQSQLFQTKRDLAVARYNVLLGGLRLKQASGQLAAQDLLVVNGLLQK
ncbi:MAG: TolC family outer membrane protein [Hydrogenophaga sp.]|uniref:TolC family outer membrane protein n=1 Tax=Hydrogenophaga sp. TaxID=1904254 RepID=UPI00272062C3|nr:TolC family outer membrane protein [Hydrogenophaga sp.]MDO9568506.1 TolC family outer membrane protein [Hydrogenophaga sp.]MDP3376256.1 TolC family outer membrane protein [Hydrogenophaga sp.]